jgi:thymidylate synthase (FAD)
LQDIVILMEKKEVLDYGHVILVNINGSDETIVKTARVSYDNGTKIVRSDAGLIDYLIRHQHTSPLEQVSFTFDLQLPIFVARQLIRHRTAKANEISGRYSILDDMFYLPEINRLNSQSTINKQGSSEDVIQEAVICKELIKQTSENAYGAYLTLLECGLSRELARIVLPTNFYTRMIWQSDLNNLLKFIKLRADSHAQYEIQVYANAMLDLIEPSVPYAVSSFKNHYMNSVTFSGDELQAIKNYLVANNVLDSVIEEVSEKLTGGRKNEFINKFN